MAIVYKNNVFGKYKMNGFSQNLYKIVLDLKCTVQHVAQVINMNKIKMYKAQSSVYIHLLIQEYLCPEHEKHYLYWSDKQTSSLRVTKVMNTVVSY